MTAAPLRAEIKNTGAIIRSGVRMVRCEGVQFLERSEQHGADEDEDGAYSEHVQA